MPKLRQWVHIALALQLLLPWPGSGVGAEEVQSLDSIYKAVKQAVLAEHPDAGAEGFSVEIGPLDPRLQLPTCTLPLEVNFPQGLRGGKNTVGVRCNGPKKWTIYLSVDTKSVVQALVAKEYLRRGTILKDTDLELREFDTQQLTYGYFTDINQVIGQSLKRQLSRGAVLTPSTLDAKRVIKRGERVTIYAEISGITVQAAGEALEQGGIGDIIRVKNLDSGKVIEGRVEGPGQVKILL